MDSVIFLIGERVDDFKDLAAILTKAHVNVSCHQSAELFLSQNVEKTGIAIIDQQLPGMAGIELLQLLLESDATISTILASRAPDTRLVVEAMQLGAHDVVDRPFDAHRLADFVIRLNAQQRHCRERLELDYVRAARIALLSPREREVFDAVTRGLTSKEIADALCISHRTVETHRSAIRQKIGSCCVTESVRAAAVVEQRSTRGKPEWVVASEPRYELESGIEHAKTNGHRPQARKRADRWSSHNTHHGVTNINN